jgi:hypothetical protein
VHRSQGLGRPRGYDDIHVEPEQLGGEGMKLIALGRMAMLKLMSRPLLPMRAVSVIRMGDRSPRCYLPSVPILRGLSFVRWCTSTVRIMAMVRSETPIACEQAAQAFAKPAPQAL